MRRKDKAITEVSEILKTMKACEICRLALFDDEFPYIIPLNFGVGEKDDQILLYFHCASEGTKLDLLKRNNKVAFEMDCCTEVVLGEIACDSFMQFMSVCGTGTVDFVESEEKIDALNQIMKHHQSDGTFEFDADMLLKTTALRLTVSSISGKRS